LKETSFADKCSYSTASETTEHVTESGAVVVKIVGQQLAHR